MTRDEENVGDLSGHTGFGIVCRLCSTCQGSLGASLAMRFFPRGCPLESKSRFLNPELPQVQVPNLFSIQARHKFRHTLMHLPLGSHRKAHFGRDAWDMLGEAIGPEPFGPTSGWLEQKLVTGIHIYVSNAQAKGFEKGELSFQGRGGLQKCAGSVAHCDLFSGATIRSSARTG